MATTDRKIERLARKYEKEDEAYEAAGLQTVLQDFNGRRWLWKLLSSTHLFANPHAGNALNTAFACGEMNVGQMLLAQITEQNPDAYLQMMKENADVERTRSEAFGKLRAAGDDDSGDGADED